MSKVNRLYNINGKSSSEVVDKFRRLLPQLGFKQVGTHTSGFTTKKNSREYQSHGFKG